MKTLGVLAILCVLLLSAGSARGVPDLSGVGPNGEIPPVKLPMSQKFAILSGHIGASTDCIVEQVGKVRPKVRTASALPALITKLSKACQDVLREMVEAHDRLFGESTGEEFFLGPYLDSLPHVVRERLDIPPPTLKPKKRRAISRRP